MTTTNKSTHGAAQDQDINPPHAFYGGNGPVNAIIDDVEDDVMTSRDDHGRFAARADSRYTDRFANRVADGVSRVAKSAQKTARKSAERAQDGAKTTAQAVRDHPAMTVAVLGGLATAAYAGIRLFKARSASNGTAEPSSTQKRKTAATVRQPTSKKH
jgi:ElaB/YqjD/DUF883 family membrane-anchored ribosome-binding protein